MYEVYGLELSRFLLILPPAPAEGLIRLQLSEVEALHGLLSRGLPCEPDQLPVHRDVLPFLAEGAVERSARGFFAAYCAAR